MGSDYETCTTTVRALYSRASERIQDLHGRPMDTLCVPYEGTALATTYACLRLVHHQARRPYRNEGAQRGVEASGAGCVQPQAVGSAERHKLRLGNQRRRDGVSCAPAWCTLPDRTTHNACSLWPRSHADSSALGAWVGRGRARRSGMVCERACIHGRAGEGGASKPATDAYDAVDIDRYR